MLDRAAIPPTPDAVAPWVATVNPGETSNQYLAHIQKPSAVLSHPFFRMAPAIRQIGWGKRPMAYFRTPQFYPRGWAAYAPYRGVGVVGIGRRIYYH